MIVRPLVSRKSHLGRPESALRLSAERAELMSAAAVQKDLERLRNAASSGVSYASPFRTAVRNIVAACRNSPAALASYCRAGVLGHLATAMQQVRHHHTADAAAVAYSLPLTLLLTPLTVSSSSVPSSCLPARALLTDPAATSPPQLISNTQMSNAVLEVALCLSQQLLVEQPKDKDGESSSYIVGESVRARTRTRTPVPHLGVEKEGEKGSQTRRLPTLCCPRA